MITRAVTRIIQRVIVAACALSLSAAAAQAQVSSKKALTLEGARRVIAAAAAEAKRLNAPGGVIAVVDDGGNLVALERLDGTFTAGANISVGKAKTAVMFKRPTKFFEDVIKNGRTAMVALPDFTPLQGGIPIEFEGQIIGGVGVSGAASAAQDEELALAGAAALKTADQVLRGGHQERAHGDGRAPGLHAFTGRHPHRVRGADHRRHRGLGRGLSRTGRRAGVSRRSRLQDGGRQGV